MTSRFVTLLFALLAASPAARAQTAADTTGIRAAALDYAEGWYSGDADRMAPAQMGRELR